jgi:MFS family permease
MITTAVICVVGQGVFGLGGLLNVWPVMLIGRLVFGFGGEVLHAAQYTLISKWFKASELSIVLGICISFPKMGSSLNAIVSPYFANVYKADVNNKSSMNVGVPLMIGLGFIIASLLIALVLCYFDKKT